LTNTFFNGFAKRPPLAFSKDLPARRDVYIHVLTLFSRFLPRSDCIRGLPFRSKETALPDNLLMLFYPETGLISRSFFFKAPYPGLGAPQDRNSARRSGTKASETDELFLLQSRWDTASVVIRLRARGSFRVAEVASIA